MQVLDEPLLSLGVVAGDSLQEFDRIVTPFVLESGNIVVPLSGRNVIRVFSSDGQHLMTLGRSGAGPDEFRSIVAAWGRGDTIEALDGRLRRITRFLPSDAVEVVGIESTVGDLSAVAGPSVDGWVIGGVVSAAPGRRDSMVVERFDGDGRSVGVITRIGGMARYAAPGFTGPEPLSPRAFFAVGNGRLFSLDSNAPEVREVDVTTAESRVFVINLGNDAQVDDAFRAVRDLAVERAGPERAVLVQQRLDAAPPPLSIPVVWGLKVDSKGFIWVRPYEPLQHAAALGGLGSPGGGPGGAWQILSADGTEVGKVSLPADLEPSYIGANHVVGIAKDELGIESVRVHRIERVDAGRSVEG